MEDFDTDELPDELDEVARRMRNDRPVASDATLDRAMTRAQTARPRRASRLLWSPRAPRVPKLSLAFGAAAIIVVAGVMGLAATPGTVNDASQVAYTLCGNGTSTVEITGTLATGPLLLRARIRAANPDIPPAALAIIQITNVSVVSLLPPRINVTFCVQLL